MYGWDTLVLLRHLLDQGLKKTAIAEQLGISRRLVYYLIETGQLDRDLAEPPPPRMRALLQPRRTKLDGYKPIITTRLETYPELSAVRLFEECRAAGYAGSLTQLKLFVRHVRPRPEVDPVIRFETAPAHQAQVDFARFQFPWGVRYALLVVLGYSRLLWLSFYPRQTLRTVMAGLEEAFAYFGGVTHELLFDQMRAVIVEDRRESGGRLLENPEFLRFAHHWDFRIRACRPYRAQTKGKVERPVRYVRDNFVYGREFVGDADLGDQLRWWLDAVANARVHATTKEVPRVRFEAAERSLLKALAMRPYQPLVLPDLPKTSERRLTITSSAHAVIPAVTVERRGLGVYQALAELAEVGA